jgi:hypothetical protein
VKSGSTDLLALLARIAESLVALQKGRTFMGFEIGIFRRETRPG